MVTLTVLPEQVISKLVKEYLSFIDAVSFSTEPD